MYFSRAHHYSDSITTIVREAGRSVIKMGVFLIVSTALQIAVSHVLPAAASAVRCLC